MSKIYTKLNFPSNFERSTINQEEAETQALRKSFIKQKKYTFRAKVLQ